jgi:hypothetical protein
MEPGNEIIKSGVEGETAPEGKVQKVREFRKRARECRASAARAPNAELKTHYDELAVVWDKLAEERLAFFVEHPEADVHGEVDADGADGHGDASA